MNLMIINIVELLASIVLLILVIKESTYENQVPITKHKYDN